MQDDLAPVDGNLDRDLRLIDLLAGGGALVGRQRAELLEQRGQLPALAEVAHAHLVEAGKIGRGRNRFERRGLQSRETESDVFRHSQVFRPGV